MRDNMALIVRCAVCKKQPHELYEYSQEATEERLTPVEYVQREEGTYDSYTGLFWCTPCYVKIGMPLGKARSMDLDEVQESQLYSSVDERDEDEEDA